MSISIEPDETNAVVFNQTDHTLCSLGYNKQNRLQISCMLTKLDRLQRLCQPISGQKRQTAFASIV